MPRVLHLFLSLLELDNFLITTHFLNSQNTAKNGSLSFLCHIQIPDNFCEQLFTLNLTAIHSLTDYIFHAFFFLP